MMIVFLILHGVCSLFLVGALSHQAAATWRRAPSAGRAAGMIAGFAAVRAPLYARSIAISYVLTMVRSRRLLTTVLAAIVWYALLAGHLLNNLKGVGF